MSSRACPVCSYDNVEQIGQDPLDMKVLYKCPRCGPFLLTELVFVKYERKLKSSKLSAWIRAHSEQKKEPPTISTDFLENHLKDLPEHTPKEKMLLFLGVLKKRAEYTGELVEIKCKTDYPLVHASQWQEMACLSQELDRLGYIKNNLASGGNLSCQMLTEGEGHLEKHETQIASLVTFDHHPKSKFLNSQYIDEQFKKCESRIDHGDYEGALTSAKTFLEAILQEISNVHEEKQNKDKSTLPKLFKQTLKNTSLGNIDDHTKVILRGLITTVHGLSELRNKAGDSHPSKITPDKRHAQLAVNTAKTIACFLAE